MLMSVVATDPSLSKTVKTMHCTAKISRKRIVLGREREEAYQAACQEGAQPQDSNGRHQPDEDHEEAAGNLWASGRYHKSKVPPCTKKHRLELAIALGLQQHDMLTSCLQSQRGCLTIQSWVMVTITPPAPNVPKPRRNNITASTL